jgi:D-alanyl-D-alanine carboxypeptidase
MIIEKVTGKPVHRVIDRLSRIAHLKRTEFPLNAALTAPFAHGYYAGDDGDQALQDYTAVNPDVPWTAGNMTSTLADLKRWAKLLGTGKLLSDRLFGRQLQIRPIDNPGGLSVGYGLGIFKLADWIGHNGAIYGFNTVMLYLPDQKARIVISANKSTNFSSETLDMFFAVAAQLFPDSV